MPKLTFSAEKVRTDYPTVDEGIYELRLDGFTPEKNKDFANKPSYNLKPILTLIGSDNGNTIPTLSNGKPLTIRDWLNTGADWVLLDFCHCFGLPPEYLDAEKKTFTIPGDFVGPEDDPKQWQYKGPLVGRKGKAYITKGEYNGKPQNSVKYYICGISDCNQKYPQVRHSTK